MDPNNPFADQMQRISDSVAPLGAEISGMRTASVAHDSPFTIAFSQPVPFCPVTQFQGTTPSHPLGRRNSPGSTASLVPYESVDPYSDLWQPHPLFERPLRYFPDHNEGDSGVEEGESSTLLSHHSHECVAHLQAGDNGKSAAIKSCSLCHVTSTPIWRCDPSTKRPLCNACGLYLGRRHKLRPQRLINADINDGHRAPPISDGGDMGPRCSRCNTRKTPVWRRSKTGFRICNACGVYGRLTGRERPPALRRNKTNHEDNERGLRQRRGPTKRREDRNGGEREVL
ncbi:hypothetical protein R3P38DRAFT_2617205 [Favolaschia claudopus]|uniref:GATA-type domain-containing protein n=1 Tax=Favolaschia claudopus TaxID=2862362 RepID=A0AAV9ZJ10_9AGAR